MSNAIGVQATNMIVYGGMTVESGILDSISKLEIPISKEPLNPKDLRKLLEDEEKYKCVVVEDWLAILVRDDLEVENELFLFEVILRWAKLKSGQESPEKLREILEPLLKNIRFPQMSEHDLLNHVQPTQILTKMELTSSLLESFDLAFSKELLASGAPDWTKARKYRSASSTLASPGGDPALQPDLAVEETMKSLQIGSQLLHLDNTRTNNGHKDLVLLVGYTGHGKTTLCQFLAGGNSNELISYEEDGFYLIRDKLLKIGQLTTVSQTFVPDLVIDAQSGTSYYDFPGYHDSRGPKTEICNSFYIKMVGDHAEKVKLVLVVDYHFVRKGGSKDGFLNVVKQTLKMVPNVKKLVEGNGVGLIVTRVNRPEVPRNDIIKGIARFLQDFRAQLSETSFPSNCIEHVHSLVDSLLVEEGSGKFKKIGIFPQPTISGSLTLIPGLEESKLQLKQLINDQIQFVRTFPFYFHYVLSPEALNMTSKWAVYLNQQIQFSVEEIGAILKKVYVSLILELEHSIRVIENDVNDEQLFMGLNVDGSISAKFEYFHKKFNSFLDGIEQLSSNGNLNGMELSQNLNELISTDEVIAIDCSKQLAEISKWVSYLNFLAPFNPQIDSESSSSEWILSFGKLRALLHLLYPLNSSNRIKTLGIVLNNRISQSTQKLVTELMDYYTTVTSQTSVNWHELKVWSEKWMTSLTRLLQNLDDEPSPAMFPQLVLSSLTHVLKSAPSGVNQAEFAGFSQFESTTWRQGKYFEFFRLFPPSTIQYDSQNGKKPLKTLETFLSDHVGWCNFLTSLYHSLSCYGIQSKVANYDVQDLSVWGRQNSAIENRGIVIGQHNLGQLIEKLQSCQSLAVAGLNWNNIANFCAKYESHLQSHHLNPLNQVLRCTLHPQMEMLTEGNDKVVFRAPYILLSEVNQTLSTLPSLQTGDSLVVVQIEAWHTIFVDEDFDLQGQNSRLVLSILAPTWEIIGISRKINLDGHKGGDGGDGSLIFPPADREPHFEFQDMGDRGRRQVHTTVSLPSTGNGQPGQPGMPGSRGGSFLGIGLYFVNSGNLTVRGNGGRGGRGGNGHVGGGAIRGRDAVHPSDSIYHPRDTPFGYTRIDESTRSWTQDVVRRMTRTEITYHLYGSPALTRGGDGGDGGGGGRGGTKGNVCIVKVGTEGNGAGIQIRAEDGCEGEGGKGGEGGGGGDSGSSIKILWTEKICKNSFKGTSVDRWWELKGNIVDCVGNSPGGNRGRDGVNFVGFIEEQGPFDCREFWQESVERFVKSLRGNFENSRFVCGSRREMEEFLGTVENCLNSVD